MRVIIHRIKYLLFIIPLFVSGCYVPYTYYTLKDYTEFVPDRYNEIYVLRDSTLKVRVNLPLIDYYHGEKYIYFGIFVDPTENCLFHINDLYIEAIDESGHILPNDGNPGIDTQQGIYHPKNFKELTDSQIYKPGSGYQVSIGTSVNYLYVKRSKSVSIHYYANILLNDKEIILDKTLKIRKTTSWFLVLGV